MPELFLPTSAISKWLLLLPEHSSRPLRTPRVRPIVLMFRVKASSFIPPVPVENLGSVVIESFENFLI